MTDSVSHTVWGHQPVYQVSKNATFKLVLLLHLAVVTGCQLPESLLQYYS